jgi:hypothetical protein
MDCVHAAEKAHSRVAMHIAPDGKKTIFVMVPPGTPFAATISGSGEVKIGLYGANIAHEGVLLKGVKITPKWKK